MQTLCIASMRVWASSPRRLKAVLISSLLEKIFPMREMALGGGERPLIKRFQAGALESTWTDASSWSRVWFGWTLELSMAARGPESVIGAMFRPATGGSEKGRRGLTGGSASISISTPLSTGLEIFSGLLEGVYGRTDSRPSSDSGKQTFWERRLEADLRTYRLVRPPEEAEGIAPGAFHGVVRRAALTARSMTCLTAAPGLVSASKYFGIRCSLWCRDKGRVWEAWGSWLTLSRIRRLYEGSWAVPPADPGHPTLVKGHQNRLNPKRGTPEYMRENPDGISMSDGRRY